jgi:hypothetical protein
MQLQKREELQRSSLCFISKSESLPKKSGKYNLLGYSLVPNYASMFRLAGENDAESIFEIQGTGSIPAKELQDISTKVLWCRRLGMGFQHTFSKFSECV